MITRAHSPGAKFTQPSPAAGSRVETSETSNPALAMSFSVVPPMEEEAAAMFGTDDGDSPNGGDKKGLTKGSSCRTAAPVNCIHVILSNIGHASGNHPLPKFLRHAVEVWASFTWQLWSMHVEHQCCTSKLFCLERLRLFAQHDVAGSGCLLTPHRLERDRMALGHGPLLLLRVVVHTSHAELAGHCEASQHTVLGGAVPLCAAGSYLSRVSLLICSLAMLPTCRRSQECFSTF